MAADAIGARRSSVQRHPARHGRPGRRPFGRSRPANRAPDAVGDEEDARHVAVLLGHARQRERRRREHQPLRAVGLEEPLEREDGPEGEHERVEVFPDEAREVGEMGGGQDEDCENGRRGLSDPAPERPGKADENEAEHGRHEAGREVRGAEDLVDERVDVVEERTVVGGVVAPVAALGERVGLVGVDRLVVVEWTIAERPEARQDRGDGDGRDEEEDPGGRPRPVVGCRPGVVQGVLLSARGIFETEAFPELTT